MPTVMAGDTDYEYHDLRFLNPGTALLRSRAIRTGLRVFVQRHGRWQIVSHLIADERTPGQPW